MELNSSGCYHWDWSNSLHNSTDKTLENHLWIYSAPFIFFLSVSGNIMTMLIMTQKEMRNTSTSIYLTLMAAADMLVVVIGIVPEWLKQMHIISTWEIHPWVCKVELYSYYTVIDIAIWILVAFTIDRVIAVCFPLHKRQYCTKTRALIACGIIYLLSNLNAHVFWTRGRIYACDGVMLSNCGDLVPYVHFEKNIRPWIVLALADLLPFLIILTGNIAIVSCVLKSRSARESKGFKQTTIMCLSISFAFLILVTPNIILLIGKKKLNKPGNLAYRVARAVASQLVYINHSVNFLLYALTGSRFREELIVKVRSVRQSRTPSLPFVPRIQSLSSSGTRNTQVPDTPIYISGKGLVWQNQHGSPKTNRPNFNRIMSAPAGQQQL